MFKRRLKRLLAVFGAMFLILTGRLFYLQIIDGWNQRAKSLRQVEKVRETPSRRGSILDRRGRPLATSESHTFDVAIILKKYNSLDAEEAAERLERAAELYGLDRLELENRIMTIDRAVEKLRGRQKDRYGRLLVAWREENKSHPIIRDLPLAKAAIVEVEASRFGFLVVKPNYRRKYPQAEVACHIVGYMRQISAEEFKRYSQEYDGSEFKAYQRTEMIGCRGIEGVANKRLRGERGVRFIISDYMNRTQDVIWEKAPTPGRDVQLTLDGRWQKIAEEELEAMGERGAMVIMEPNDGAVLVAASVPRYDPATVRRDYRRLASDPNRPLFNRAMYGLYPMGSVFKVVVALAGLETGALTEEKTYFCGHEFKIGKTAFGCLGYHGEIGVRRALKVSCNIFFYKLALDCGPLPIAAWAKKLGLGRPTGCALGGNTHGRVPSPATERPWFKGDTLNLAIGQGKLTATPLQVARMMAVFANGGFLVKPRILARTRPIRERIDGSPQFERHVQLIREAMRAVVAEHRGTAHRSADSTLVALAGKTGTAQVPKRNNKDNKHGWFAGYTLDEAGRPKYAFAVVVEDINPEAHGGDSAGAVAKKVFERIKLKEGESF